MSKFKLPARDQVRADQDAWVTGGNVTIKAAKPAKSVQARLTIDLPVELHTEFKTACAKHRTRMVEEVTTFIRDWTQKHI